MKKEKSTYEMFLDGTAFAKLKNASGVDKLAKKVAELDGDITVDKSTLDGILFESNGGIMIKDGVEFEGIDEFVAVYDKQSKEIKLASREFFDHIYLYQPQTCINKSKCFWFEL